MRKAPGRADPDAVAPAAGGDRVFDLEPHSERRRRQLLTVTAHIIETEGPDAVRMPRVAELAGCTRTLVYRYFPQREDLLAGVVSRFYERLNALTSAEEHARGIAGLAEVDPEVARRTSRGILAAAWDVVEEQGMGGLILARSEFPGSRQPTQQASEHATQTELRWFRPLRAAGLSDAACAVALECAISITYSLMTRFRAGAIRRDEALELGFRGLHSLVLGLRSGEPARPPTPRQRGA